MLSSTKLERRGVDYILDIISKYNRLKSEEDGIKFIHGGTSANLAFIGRIATVTRFKASEILTIPHALIPSKQLRKKYGIDLHLHQLSMKKDALNYKYLLGAVANSDGISMCYQQANNVNPIKISEIHRVVVTTILEMEPTTYIRSLKKLLTLMTSLILMDPSADEKIEHYLALLENVRKNLKERIDAHHYFDKYIPRIENILRARAIPFQPDDKFRTEILNQYPIIFCSIVESKTVSEANHRKFYDGELALPMIKILFTPQQHVGRLKAKLKEIGLQEQIKVYGYAAEIGPDNPFIIENQDENEVAAFLNASTTDELCMIADRNPTMMAAKKIVEEKMLNCLTAYLDGKGNEYLTMAAWLMINANSKAMENMPTILNDSASFSMYELLQSRSRTDQAYLKLVGNILSLDYLARLGEMLHLKAMLTLRQRIDNFHLLLDYERDLAPLELHNKIKPHAEQFKDDTEYLCEYLSRLQNLYAVWSRAKGAGKELERINARLAFAKKKYKELLDEYCESNEINDATLHSELYQSLKTASK